MKLNKKIVVLTGLLCLVPILIGLIFWNELPDPMPTHFGADNQPDGWSSKASAVFTLPLVLVAIHCLCVFVTGKDPKNQGQHQKLMGMVPWLVPAISLMVNAMMYAAALGYTFSVTAILPAFLGVLLIVCGNYLPKCK